MLPPRNVGAPLEAFELVQLGLPIYAFGLDADHARTYRFRGEQVGNSLIIKADRGAGYSTP